jgi:hypothetical protein
MRLQNGGNMQERIHKKIGRMDVATVESFPSMSPYPNHTPVVLRGQR